MVLGRAKVDEAPLHGARAQAHHPRLCAQLGEREPTLGQTYVALCRTYPRCPHCSCGVACILCGQATKFLSPMLWSAGKG